LRTLVMNFKVKGRLLLSVTVFRYIINLSIFGIVIVRIVLKDIIVNKIFFYLISSPNKNLL